MDPTPQPTVATLLPPILRVNSVGGVSISQLRVVDPTNRVPVLRIEGIRGISIGQLTEYEP